MDMSTDDPTPVVSQSRSPRRRSLALIGLGGLMVGFLAAGAVGTAGAQSDSGTTSEPVPDVQADFDVELSPEDEAVFDKFDACLDEAEKKVEGELDGEGVELTPQQEQAIDAAFEGCEPILDGLSADAQVIMDGELSCDEDLEGSTDGSHADEGGA